MKVLLVDNFDSFTYMLRDYILRCGVECEVVRNGAPLIQTALSAYDAVVISPGPETPAKAGNVMPFLQNHIGEKPLLGVCLGHQAIGEHYGAVLTRAILPRHGKTDAVRHNGHALFNHIPASFEATRYHSLILKAVKAPLQVIAETAAGEVMAVAHESLPVYGVQFHPESCKTAYGGQIIENFLSLARQ